MEDAECPKDSDWFSPKYGAAGHARGEGQRREEGGVAEPPDKRVGTCPQMRIHTGKPTTFTLNGKALVV